MTKPADPFVVAVRFVFAAALLATASNRALAWHAEGHEMAVRVAVAALPERAPDFFREGADAIARDSLDPDLFRGPSAPELTVGEGPEHFFDLELLQGQPFPADRYALIRLCGQLKVDPRQVGMLPYSVAEWTQRLMVAFAEHRRRPNDAAVRAKCLVYAGILSHYSADLCQPLHVTVHYDGRVGTDGKSPHSGIHNKVDALPRRLDRADIRVQKTAICSFEKGILAAAFEEIGRSHALVNRVYQLEPKLPEATGDWARDEEVISFASERMAASATFIARLYLTAWEQSAKVDLPAWSGP